MVRAFESHPAPTSLVCTCGAVHNPYILDRHAHAINGQLVRCHACDVHNVGLVTRRVCRDVVCRYIRRFGGSTFQVQTDFDNAETYLRDVTGLAIAQVSFLSRFPEQVTDSEIPY